MKKIFSMLFALTAMWMIGCSEEEELFVDTTPQLGVTCNTDIQLPSSNATEGTITYQVIYPLSADVIATAESDATWLRPQLSTLGTMGTSPQGLPMLTAKIHYATTANKGAARTATLTITYAGKHEVALTIRQPASGVVEEAKPSLQLTAASASVEAAAGSVAIEYHLTNPSSGSVTATSSAAWAVVGSTISGTTEKNSKGETVLTASIPVTYEANTGAARTATINLTYGDLTTSFTLKQAAASGGGDDPTPPTPPAPGADEMAGKYMLIWKVDGVYKAATPAATYYILSKDVTVADHAVTAAGNSDAEWTIEVTSTTGQYTIKGSDGKYYAMKGTYNSFNTDATLTNSELSYHWTISKESDGTWTVMNVDKQKWMQWDANYGNAIASTGAGARPMLFKLNAAGTAYENLSPVEGGDDPGSDDPVTPPTPPTPTGKTMVSGWAELPETIEKSGDYYYTWHITDVKYANGNKARNYTVCYSKDKMCAMWVAAPMHDFYEVKNSDRTDDYATDPNIDFTQPGKWDGYTRGHLLGSSERLVSRKANQQVFYYSNIAPQYGQPYFNTGGGAWNTLEDYTQQQWAGAADTTYQVIGCYWDPAKSVKKVNGTTIPTHYYKVLLRTKNHVNKAVWQCSADELQCVAFMIEHKTYDKSEVPNKSTYVSKGIAMSVADLEKKTGFVYFGNVPNAPKNTFNASDWGL